MRRSIESSRPMIAQRGTTNIRSSVRYSTYSTATSDTAYTEKSNSVYTDHSPLVSGMTTTGNDTRTSNELSKYKSGIDRLESKRLNEQRYTPSSEKELDMDKAAVLGRVQKALDRRLTGQDCEMKPKRQTQMSEKRG